MIGFTHYYKTDELVQVGNCSIRRLSAKPLTNDVEERFVQYVNGTLEEILPEDFGNVTEIPERLMITNLNDALIERSTIRLALPDTVKAIGEGAFNNEYIKEFIFPPNVSTIGQDVLSNSATDCVADFSRAMIIPTRLKAEEDADYNSFGTDVTTIKVPSSLYSTWKNKADWNNVASKLISV